MGSAIRYSDRVADWEFAIDVGGTFTDVVARSPGGALRTLKILSSGVFKGVVTRGYRDGFFDVSRKGDPDRFWLGAEVRLYGPDGERRERGIVQACRAGRFYLGLPLPGAPAPGSRYELAFPGAESPVVAIRYLLGLGPADTLPRLTLKLGTTRGTNALLTRQGARTAFVATRGFGDLLRIGNQDRPRLFDLDIRKPEPLFSESREVGGRLDAAGHVLEEPDTAQIREVMRDLRAAGIESVAICLLHATANPDHERLVADLAAEEGFKEISASHEVAPHEKIVARGETTVLDAYLNPVLRRYVAGIGQVLGPRATFKAMTSAGGLVDAASFRGRDCLLSGPAGGVVGYARAARAAGLDRAIGFDMGGTSTDVSRWDGRYELEFEAEKAGVRIVAPMMAIETVAAGGGSVCRFDGVKLVVGPDSAGADPGPACYGRGGPLTVTDLNLVLGRLPAGRFPFPLDREAPLRLLEELCDQVSRSPLGRKYEPLELAEGLLAIANANMVHAIRRISVSRGYDPAEYALVCFGGAAGQHACAVASELGIGRILAHPLAGILSAYGIASAEVRRFKTRALLRPFTADASCLAELEEAFDRLAAEAVAEIRAEGVPEHQIDEAVRFLDLRYRGVDVPLGIREPARGSGLDPDRTLGDGPGEPPEGGALEEGHGEPPEAICRPGDSRAGHLERYLAWREAYEREHEQLFGYRHPGRELEVVALRVEVAQRSAERSRSVRPAVPRHPEPDEKGLAIFAGRPHCVGIYSRCRLRPGDVLEGPAIVCEEGATLVVEPGWIAQVSERDDVMLSCRESRPLEGPGRAEPGRVEAAPSASRRSASPGGRARRDHPNRHGLYQDRSPGRGPQDVRFGATRQGAFYEGARQDVSQEAMRQDTSHEGKPPGTPREAVDPVRLEIFHNHFGSIAEQMGQVLRRTACSTNVKERLDFSCALFTRDGSLVVNAPHIPVHLGAMSETVRAILRDIPDLAPGDVIVTNDPYRGGSHLPDVTVVSPVFLEGALRFFVASRAHHADIGGLVPGSMPPFSRHLSEEGVVIRNFRLLESGRPREAELAEILKAGGARDVAANLADLRAQMAANRAGSELLAELVRRVSLPVVEAYMGHIQAAAAAKMRQALLALPAGRRSFSDHMDDGTPIAVTIDLEPGGAVIDFSGTGPVVPGNLNANRAIVTAAVLYSLRCLLDEDIPLNQGVLDPIEIRIPPGSLLDPPDAEDPALAPAVVGGNVETSQRLVDVLLGALGLAAASQGTMNNLAFGDATFGYYETLCGGAGATPDGPGADAVHTHMTNTRLTDPEVLERRYPVRLWRFAIRRGSGGRGRHRGGDGVIREIEFLRPLGVSILSERRGEYPPFGLAGGGPGMQGRNLLWRRGAARPEILEAKVQIRVEPGDRLVLETPGGGAYGAIGT